MGAFKDMTGQVFNDVKVVAFAEMRRGFSLWKCSCLRCGAEHERSIAHLRNRACNCRRSTHGESSGAKRTVEYKTWARMINRCCDKRNAHFKEYGGRGITVCDAWRKSYERFLADMGRRPSSKHSIDRIDNDGGYGPDNCRWAIKTVQNRNTRRNRILTLNGVSKSLPEWADSLGVTRVVLETRVRRWPIERALTTRGAVKS